MAIKITVLTDKPMSDILPYGTAVKFTWKKVTNLNELELPVELYLNTFNNQGAANALSPRGIKLFDGTCSTVSAGDTIIGYYPQINAALVVELIYGWCSNPITLLFYIL